MKWGWGERALKGGKESGREKALERRSESLREKGGERREKKCGEPRIESLRRGERVSGMRGREEV